MKRLSVVVALALAASAISPLASHAEMGPCLPDEHGNFICGTGDGAARVIPKTSSPSGRLALAWRLTNRPPNNMPYENDPSLENLIVRSGDGAILAKSPGGYWNTDTRTAKGWLSTAWSPDSRLLIRETAFNNGPDSVELFAIADDDSLVGPVDLLRLLDPAVRAEMTDVQDADKYSLRISYGPKITIDNNGLVHASVYMWRPESDGGPAYDVTAQVTHTERSLDAKIISVSLYRGPRISVTIH
jgi:hypothetical protein